MNQFEYIGQTDLLNYVEFIDESLLNFYSSNSISQAVELISQSQQRKKLPILLLDSNPINVDHYIDKLYEYFTPTDFFVLTADSATQIQKSNVAHWPFCLIMQQQSNQNYQQVFQKQYRIGCLSRVPRYHRLCLLQAIKPYVTSDDVVVANKFDANIPTEVKQDSKMISYYQHLPYTNNKDYLDLNLDIDYCSVNHPAYRACINITNESYYKNDLIFLSEKTWKAYASGCLVINYGSQLVPAQLKKYGIEIWEEYDKCLEFTDKIRQITELFQRSDIKELYQTNLKLIKHNQELVTSLQFAKKLSQPAIEKIQQLL